MPDLQRAQGVVWFLRHHRGHPFASSALMDPISKAFVACIATFVAENAIPVLSFVKGQRKDDIAATYRAAFTGKEGVLFVGRAQEKTPVFREVLSRVVDEEFVRRRPLSSAHPRTRSP